MSQGLTIAEVSKSYGGSVVLQNVSLAITPGEYVTILGPSGAGKTTLLRLIAGFERPEQGRVSLGTEDITMRSAHERGIGVVFQSFALFPHLNVFDNVAFGLRHRAVRPMRDERGVQRDVTEVLRLVGLNGFEKRQVGEISGGQKQRVALARCLVSKPAVVLLDEPLGALDANLRNQMTLELARIHRQIGATFLHVTGNEQEALAMGDRVAVLDAGKIAQFDDPRSLFEGPASPRVAQLLNAYNHIESHRISPSSASTTSATSLVLVRNDRVQVAVEGAHVGERVGLTGRYVASEYAGSRVLALFDVGASRHFEVEYHLGHTKPPELTPGHRYFLNWNPDDALRYGAAA